MKNLYEETEKFLKDHRIQWTTIRFISVEYGYIDIAEFAILAKGKWYEEKHDRQSPPCVDPSLKIVGGSWWLEREITDFGEGWVYKRKPEKPKLKAANFKL